MAIANWTCVSWVAYAPGNIAVNVTWIEREFNAYQTHRSMYHLGYLQPFTSYSEILVGNRNFSYPLAFNAPVRSGPGTIAVNVTRLERGFNACKTPCCIYPSIFNRFPVIQAWSLKIRHFSTIFAHFGLPCVRLWDNRSKCHTVGKRIQYNTFIAIHLPRLSEGRTQGGQNVQ